MSQPRKPKRRHLHPSSKSNRVSVGSSLSIQAGLTNERHPRRQESLSGRDGHLHNHMCTHTDRRSTSEVVAWTTHASANTTEFDSFISVQNRASRPVPPSGPRSCIEMVDYRPTASVISSRSSAKSSKVTSTSSSLPSPTPATATRFNYSAPASKAIRPDIPPRAPELPRLPTPELELPHDSETDFCPCCPGTRRGAPRDQYDRADSEWKMQYQREYHLTWLWK
jgi:hypothetical protein